MTLRPPAPPRLLLVFLALLALLCAAPPLGRAQITDADVRTLSERDSGESDDSGGNNGGMAGAVVRMVASLALVLALMILIAWLWRRYGPRASGASVAGTRGDAIRILSVKPLGAQRSLMLVRVRGQTVLLGVTPHAVNALAELPDLESDWAQPPENGPRSEDAPQAGPFARQLHRAVDRTLGPEDDEAPPSQRM